MSLSFVLLPRLGALGAAIALISSDVIAQSGVLSLVILRETLNYPVRFSLFLLALMAAILAAGTSLGESIGYLVPGVGLGHFVLECTFWLIVVGLVASPLAIGRLRDKLIAILPI